MIVHFMFHLDFLSFMMYVVLLVLLDLFKNISIYMLFIPIIQTYYLLFLYLTYGLSKFIKNVLPNLHLYFITIQPKQKKLFK
jgi:hypothetical protein